MRVVGHQAVRSHGHAVRAGGLQKLLERILTDARLCEESLPLVRGERQEILVLANVGEVSKTSRSCHGNGTGARTVTRQGGGQGAGVNPCRTSSAVGGGRGRGKPLPHIVGGGGSVCGGALCPALCDLVVQVRGRDDASVEVVQIELLVRRMR